MDQPRPAIDMCWLGESRAGANLGEEAERGGIRVGGLVCGREGDQ